MRLLIVIVNYRTASLTIDCLRSLAPEIPTLPSKAIAREPDRARPPSPGTPGEGRGGGFSSTEAAEEAPPQPSPGVPGEGARATCDRAALPPDPRVVVTDNASGDDSVARIGEAMRENGWASWAELMPLPRNGGFAYGNNEAIRPALQSQSPPDYVLLLNPDTVVRPGAVRALLDFMDASPKVGIAGSRLEHPDGKAQRSAFRFPGALSELEEGLRLSMVSKVLKPFVVAPPPPETACRVDWVAGASMMVRRAVFESVGLMDEAYFMYYEEVDFCRRANRASWPCWYVPASRVVHLVGQSSGVTDEKKPKKRQPEYWFASRRRYFQTHTGRVRTFLADTFFVVGHGLYKATVVARRKPANDPVGLLGDFVRYNFLGPPQKA